MGPRKHAKRKNRSSDTVNASNGDISVEKQKADQKRQRQNSSARQCTLSEYVSGDRMSARGDAKGDANKTFTTESDSLSRQLGQIEERINTKIEALHDYLAKIESNIANEISTQFEKLRGEFFVLQEAFDNLKEKVLVTEDTLEDMQDEVDSLRKMVVREGERRNDLEQYQRRESVRFLGVGPDSKAEKAEECEHKIMTLIRRELKLNINTADISVMHRIGIPGTRPRPVIVKFVTRKHKMEVLAKRRLLKGTKKVIVEDLTPLNMSRLTTTKQHPNVLTTWTKDGKIHALLKNNTVVKVLEGDMTVLNDNRSAGSRVEGAAKETFHGHRTMRYSHQLHPFPASPMTSTPSHPNQCPRMGGTSQFQRSCTRGADRSQWVGRNERPRTTSDEPGATGGDPDQPSTTRRSGKHQLSTAGHGGTDLPSTVDRSVTDLPSTAGHGGKNQPSTAGHGGTVLPSTVDRGGTDLPSTVDRGVTDRPSTAGHGGKNQPSTTGHGGTVLPSTVDRGGTDLPSTVDRSGTNRLPPRSRSTSDSPGWHLDRDKRDRRTSSFTRSPRPNRMLCNEEVQHHNTKL